MPATVLISSCFVFCYQNSEQTGEPSLFLPLYTPMENYECRRKAKSIAKDNSLLKLNKDKDNFAFPTHDQVPKLLQCLPALEL